jgi:hypothetical protein
MYPFALIVLLQAFQSSPLLPYLCRLMLLQQFGYLAYITLNKKTNKSIRYAN